MPHPDEFYLQEIEAEPYSLEWVEERLIEMVQVHLRRPDRERKWLRGLISGHPQTTPDWETHLAAADAPVDPDTGKQEKRQSIGRPPPPDAKAIDRCNECDGWIPRFVTVIEHRRVLGATLIVKAQGHNTIWPRVRRLMQRSPRSIRYSDNTLRRRYRNALGDIAAGVREGARKKPIKRTTKPKGKTDGQKRT